MNNKVNILGTIYKIKEASYGEMYDDFGDSVKGYIDYDKKIIKYNKDDKIKTLMHEYFHGLFFEAGFTVENEENLIEFLCRHIEKIIVFYANTLPIEGEEDADLGQKSVSNPS